MNSKAGAEYQVAEASAAPNDRAHIVNLEDDASKYESSLSLKRRLVRGTLGTVGMTVSYTGLFVCQYDSDEPNARY